MKQLVILFCIFVSSEIFARQLPSISDTLTVGELMQISSTSRHDTLQYRDTMMRHVFLRNEKDDPVSVVELEWNGQDNYNTLNATVTNSSFIVLPGEVVKVADIQYQHKAVKSTNERGFLKITKIRFGTSGKDYVIVTYNAYLRLNNLLSKNCFDLGYEKTLLGPVKLYGVDSVMLSFFSNRMEPVTISVSTSSQDKSNFDLTQQTLIEIPPLSYIARPIYYKPTYKGQSTKDRHLIELQIKGNWDGADCKNYSLTIVGVTDLPSTVNDIEGKDLIQIHPNPMSDAVHIRNDGINDAHIEIYSLLGERIFQYRGNEVSWDRLTISGSRAPAGTYFVRISGSRSGSPYVVSKKLIVR